MAPQTLRTIPTSALRQRLAEHTATIQQILEAELVISTTYVSAERQSEVIDLVVRKRNCEEELRRRGMVA